MKYLYRVKPEDPADLATEAELFKQDDSPEGWYESPGEAKEAYAIEKSQPRTKTSGNSARNSKSSRKTG